MDFERNSARGGEWRAATVAANWPRRGNVGKPGQSVFSKVESVSLTTFRQILYSPHTVMRCSFKIRSTKDLWPFILYRLPGSEWKEDILPRLQSGNAHAIFHKYEPDEHGPFLQ